MSDQPMLFTKKALAQLLNLSERSVSRKVSAGLIPKAINLSGTKRWIRAEILEWIAAGCPPSDRWERVRDKNLHRSRR
jgi:predicted DNA-binding transcriptional regulator AlpA